MADKIAVFDLDRTITRRGTYLPFLVFAAWRRQPWRLAFLPAALAAMAGYKLGLMTRGQLKERMLAWLLGAPERTVVAALAMAFVERLMAQGLKPGALAAIAAHRAAGDRLILATASFDFYAREFARRLGFCGLVATRAAWDQAGRLLPRIDGANCYGPAKLAMLRAHLRQAGIEEGSLHLVFYSDDRADLPTLEWARQGYVVDPRRGFARQARRMGFPILAWA